MSLKGDQLEILLSLYGQGFFLVFSGAKILPLSQWKLGYFFPIFEKKNVNLKKKKKKKINYSVTTQATITISPI